MYFKASRFNTGLIKNQAAASANQATSSVQRVISNNFSQPWEIYRIVTSTFPGMPKLHELESYYTYDMIMDLIEILDVNYALEEERVLKQKQDMKNKERR